MSDTNKTLVETLYRELKDEGAHIKVTPSGMVSINEEKLPSKNVLTFLQGRCRVKPSYNPLLLMETTAFLAHFRVIHAQAVRTVPTYDEVEVNNYNYDGLIPFQSVTDASKFVVFDTREGSVTDLDYATFKQNRDTARIEPIKGRIEFNPYIPKPIDFRNDQYGRPCNFLNTYKKPEWQFTHELPVNEIGNYKPNPLFKEFMRHLFPEKRCREAVYDWLHFALTDRCETYLVLNGAKGIGKNLFSENFCRPLMGVNNHKIAQPSALTSDFNALLKESRMIVFDEFRVDTPEKINKLKRYVNEEQMIEQKGKDVDATTKTFNSFIISNNDMADMKISWDDRRFSVADLTKTKLADVWTTAKIDELINLFKDTNEIRAIGYWLMYRKPTNTKFYYYRGSHFYALCYSSFAEWQRTIVDMALSKQFVELTNIEVKKEYRKRTETNKLPSFAKVKDFIDNYRHNGELPLGEFMKQSGDSWIIALNEAFTSKEEPINVEEIL